MGAVDGLASSAARDLWAITSYFNPLSYRSRRANYRTFRERLGIPLIAVELAYGPTFELGEGDADILIQLRGGDVLWQKERLLNLALDKLPKECAKVAWIDCDVLFGAADWSARARKLLDHVPIAQLYGVLHYLGGDTPAVTNDASADETRISITSAVASGLDAETCLEQGNRPGVGIYSTGIAWAARRDLLEEHSFYDSFIIGGGDRGLVVALYGCFDHLVRRQRLNERQLAHFLTWAQPLREAVGGAVGFVAGDLFHLWHGALEHRRWYGRYRRMPEFGFDPTVDIAIGKNGAWRWNSDKPDLHAYVHDHFALRREDG